MAECVICARVDAGVAYACPRCADRTAERLVGLAGIAPELITTVARQARSGDGGTGTDREPLPVDLGASYDVDAVTDTIGTWVRHILTARGIVITARRERIPGPVCPTTIGSPTCRHGSCHAIVASGQPVHRLAVTVRWLARQTEWIRHQPNAAQVLDELDDACRLATRIVDRRAARWYAGSCGTETGTETFAGGPTAPGGYERVVECPADLYAHPGAQVIRCGACGAVHDAADRREWLLDSARDQLVHAELLGRALAALEVPCKPAQIRDYAHRGRIVAHGRDAAGRPTYRVGEVLDVLAQIAEARQADRAARDTRSATRPDAA